MVISFLPLKESMVWFRMRLTLLQEEISQKKRKNSKDKLKSKMVDVTVSFSGRSGGRVGTSFGGKLPKGHGFESRSDFRSSTFVLSV